MATRLTFLCPPGPTARFPVFGQDEPLGDAGVAAVRAVSPLFERTRRVFTAPERCTIETAGVLDRPQQVESALADWNYGRWKGLPLSEVAAHEPEGMATWAADPSSAPHGGETLVQFVTRVWSWLNAQNASEPALVIASAATIRAAIVAAVKAPPYSFWHFDVAPLSVATLSFAGERWRLRSLQEPKTSALDVRPRRHKTVGIGRSDRAP